MRDFGIFLGRMSTELLYSARTPKLVAGTNQSSDANCEIASQATEKPSSLIELLGNRQRQKFWKARRLD
jgi:hypothetical protein